MGHSKADEDSRSIKIFHAKPSFVGFQCAFKVDSKSKDFKIKLKRGKNELKTAYNERIYVEVFSGRNRVKYYSDQDLARDESSVHVSDEGYAIVHYLKTSH